MDLSYGFYKLGFRAAFAGLTTATGLTCADMGLSGGSELGFAPIVLLLDSENSALEVIAISS